MLESFEIREVAGAMHQTERRPQILTRLKYGFDRERLYIRLDGAEAMADLLAAGYIFTVTFLEPKGVRVSIRQDGDRPVVSVADRIAAQEPWAERPFSGAVAAGTVLELSLPVDAVFGERITDRLAFVATACDPSGSEVERHPRSWPVRVTIPNQEFEARNWTA